MTPVTDSEIVMRGPVFIRKGTVSEKRRFPSAALGYVRHFVTFTLAIGQSTRQTTTVSTSYIDQTAIVDLFAALQKKGTLLNVANKQLSLVVLVQSFSRTRSISCLYRDHFGQRPKQVVFVRGFLLS